MKISAALNAVLLRLSVAVVTAVSIAMGVAQSASFDFATWGVRPGYRLAIDSSGYFMPTAVAMVPNPGTGPDDVAYFVAELRGSIKVVTNARVIHHFGEVTTAGRQDTTLGGESQHGLAGLCLAPEEGLLFATYTEPDSLGTLRNRIAKFRSTPITYGLTAVETTYIGEILADYPSSPAHQIGGCVVLGDELYLGVGDGGRSLSAADPELLVGKIICMDFTGQPCREPAFQNGGPSAYTYAYGFRNPFGLVARGNELFAAENGIDLDRFVKITKGADHLWRGSDEDIASMAEVVFPRAMGPVQTAWVPAGTHFMDPDWSGHFVSAIFGTKEIPGGIISYGGTDDNDLDRSPSFLIENVGPRQTQPFAGVAVGPDGLYVVPMLDVGGGGGAVVRLYYDPVHAHPVRTSSPRGLFQPPGMRYLTSLGCTGCHNIEGIGGGIGPALNNFDAMWGMTRYLNTAEFEEILKRRDPRAPDAPSWFETARSEILAESGTQRVWVWLGYFLKNPRFAEPDVQMPNLDLTDEQIDGVRSELFAALRMSYRQPTPPFTTRAIDFVKRNARYLGLGVVAGSLATATLLVGSAFLFRWSRRRTRS